MTVASGAGVEAASVTGPRLVAVVTGGARRLGRHLCFALAARGYDVVCLYRTSDEDAQALVDQVATAGGRAAQRFAGRA